MVGPCSHSQTGPVPPSVSYFTNATQLLIYRFGWPRGRKSQVVALERFHSLGRPGSQVLCFTGVVMHKVCALRNLPSSSAENSHASFRLQRIIGLHRAPDGVWLAPCSHSQTGPVPPPFLGPVSFSRSSLRYSVLAVTVGGRRVSSLLQAVLLSSMGFC